MRLKWKHVLVLLQIVLTLTQDRWTVCVKRTIGSKIIFDAHDGTPRGCGSCRISLFFHLETVLVCVQHRCTVYVKRNIGSEIIFGHTWWYSKVTRLKWKLGPFGNSVSVGARLAHGLRQMYHRLRNRFGRTRLYSEVMWLKWKLSSFRDSVNLDAREVHSLRRTYHRLKNHFGCIRWNS
jgi:hypothetical protein